MTKKNFLLGKGKRLTTNTVTKFGGGPTDTPYTFQEARDCLMPMIVAAYSEIKNLPDEACPNNEAVISLTLHPEYVAKSYFPNNLLREAGFSVIGSKPKAITPRKCSGGREAEPTVTTELFAKGTRSSVYEWSQNLSSWSADRPISKELISIEQVGVPSPQYKIKGDLPCEGLCTLEAVLHADKNEKELIETFEHYLETQNIDVKIGKWFKIKGLFFLQIKAPVERACDIATFTSVRALRKMPELRNMTPIIRSFSMSSPTSTILKEPPISADVKVAIFDGGISKDHSLTR